MITIRAAADACERILGSIRTVEVSAGAVAANVTLGDELVITISPLQGQVLIATQKWLHARPKQSDTLRHTNISKEEDWHYCTTTSFNDMCRALHLAFPALEHRASLAERIAERLGGVKTRQLHETDPEYWTALARWIDGSKLLTRNNAKWAHRYARQLHRGGQISDAFRAWAMRTAAEAVELGFTATKRIDLPDDAQDPAFEDGDEPPFEVEPPAAVPPAVQRLVDQLHSVDQGALDRLAAAPAGDEAAATRVRAAVIRAGAREEQRAAKNAVAEAVRGVRARLGPSPAVDRLAALAADTAAALAVRASIDAGSLNAALAAWEQATGFRLD